MSGLKIQISTVFLFGLSLYFATPVLAAECVPSAVSKVVAHGGSVEGALDSLTTKDSQGISLGSTVLTTGGSGKSGWAVIDLGCFGDHNGVDLRVFEIGRAHGAEVYVAQDGASTKLTPSASGNPGTGWARIKEATPPHFQPFVCTRSECGGYKEGAVAEFCDGRETLPEAGDGCVTGDQWFNLDISSTVLTTGGGLISNKNYRYVFIWSDKGAQIDAVGIVPSSQSVDLFIPADSARSLPGQSLSVTTPGVYNFAASLDNFGVGSYEYVFSCDEGHVVPTKGSVNVYAGQTLTTIGGLSCGYQTFGAYRATISVLSPLGDVIDSATLTIAALRTNAPVGGDKDSFAFVIFVGVVIFGIIFELARRARLKNNGT